MTDSEAEGPPTPEKTALGEHLSEQRPTPSVALKRRVRFTIGTAVDRESLRGRAAVLTGSGLVLLLVGIVLALSGPR